MGRVGVELDRLDSDLGGFGDERDAVDLLRMRADILRGVDRALMKMYLERGCGFGEMARLMGVSEATVRRRVRKLTERLMDGRYIACVRNRRRLGREELGMARDRFIEGLSLGEIAAKRRVSVYRVRKGLRRIRSLLRSEGACGRPPVD